MVVSGNGPTLVPVGADGAPLAPAMTWMDRRGVEEARIVSEASGAPTDPTFYLPKALWIFRNRPRLYEQARWFFSCPEYLAYVLTGIPSMFLPTPQYTRYIWDEPLIAALGMDPGQFPPFVPSGRILGPVSPAGEAATGIPAGVPVVSGGPDFIVSLLGTATVAPGRACIRAGTSEGINLCSAQPGLGPAAAVREPRRGGVLERLGDDLDLRQGPRVVPRRGRPGGRELGEPVRGDRGGPGGRRPAALPPLPRGRARSPVGPAWPGEPSSGSR